ncbi:hypothetical protein GCK32_013279, partial [Trichostrongylus colubriformis]
VLSYLGSRRHTRKCCKRISSAQEKSVIITLANCLNLLQPAEIAELQQEISAACEAPLRNSFRNRF